MKMLVGDCRETLKKLPDLSVHCCVTSPPYYGLRNYGCDGQIGLEQTPEEYVIKMVGVFTEVKRVLRDDGTLWLNIGDSYQGSWGNSGNRPELDGQSQGQREKKSTYMPRGGWDNRRDRPASSYKHPSIKSKDLIGIPWMLAFALRADGWYLRSDVIWHKPNAMCESVEDRPAKSHEYFFLFAKSQRYYYDHIAVRQRAQPQSIARIQQANFNQQTGGPKDYANGVNPNRSARKAIENFAANPGANLRTVWTIPTAAFGGGHFATFPEKLVKPCILAGTSAKGCCPKCGAPWKRVTTRLSTTQPLRGTEPSMKRSNLQGDQQAGVYVETKTIGWEPMCKHKLLDPVPCTVLDPFGGAGTTGLVADRLGRNFILCELNPEYAEMAKGRIKRKGVPRAAKKKPAPGGFDV